MAKNEQNKLCKKDIIFRFLDNVSNTPSIIISDPYLGPRILYETKHSVDPVPFHSQEKGIIASMIITMDHNVSEKDIKEALKTTNASYI
ncbi:MAG: hypothetical protein ACRC42_02975 [Mycoplasma sp.]